MLKFERSFSQILSHSVPLLSNMKVVSLAVYIWVANHLVYLAGGKYTSTHPENGSVAGIAGRSEVFLILAPTRNSILLLSNTKVVLYCSLQQLLQIKYSGCLTLPIAISNGLVYVQMIRNTYVRTKVPTPPALCRGTPVPRQKKFHHPIAIHKNSNVHSM